MEVLRMMSKLIPKMYSRGLQGNVMLWTTYDISRVEKGVGIGTQDM